MKNEVEQIALQNDMSIEFVTWFFNEKKVGCGNVWFMMMAAMWEGWKGRSIEMDKLATENVALKNVFSQKEIPSEAVDAFMETAVMDHDWNETSEWSWVENETEVIHAVLDALKPETPATDRIVAGIKADGVALVKSAFEMHIQSASCYQDEIVGMESALSIACQVESQLREGADK
ncbi:TPA: hypothetical protein ND790_005148 [Klebsiella pneumoniae]|uniref:hypothetical protein n=1 Tax=Klebsiella pneumoniae TaxID=573 RepID=UPI003890405E|nr:hypothetical protein [Klebsiella pneumoniae]HCC6404245.1 hypothetical protein [Klebsiella pneumoniae]HCC6468824.1 hypothetical protein [Klebsiella pneumoniae]HCD8260925.1 hypothetical protein [Klebsiella pneumoniae]